MSKNIVIQEGGTAKQLTVDKLKTNEVGGGSCNWVPEDEVGLATLNVSENGTYTASSEGHYGYSQVTVNVPGGAGGPPGGAGSSVVGKDGSGNDIMVSVDQNGNIEEVELPSSIDIVTPPTQTIYEDGEAIDLTGAVVKAYKADGELWTNLLYPDSIIPVAELIPDPDAADISQTTDYQWDVSGLGLNAPVYMDQIKAYEYYIGEGETESRFFTSLTHTSPVYVLRIPHNEGRWDCCFVSLEFFRGDTRRVCPPSWSPQVKTYVSQEVTVGDYTAYVAVVPNEYAVWNVPESAAQSVDVGTLAVLTICGGSLMSGMEEIAVKWNRPGDGLTLEDTFAITVTEDNVGNSGSSGDNPDPEE